jgi:MSHA biogenesis protein MshP
MNARFAQRGVALLPALFLLIFVAALIAFALRIGTTQRQSANFALLGDRAVGAANAGIEWGRARATAGNCAAGPTTIQLTETGLRGFRVQVRCTQVAPGDAVAPYQVFDIDARSQWGVFGSAEYVSRYVRRQF